MDEHGQIENVRHKPDQYKSVHAQWMMPQQQQMKDNYTMRLIAIMAERDGALQELNKALGEKREALAERDKAYLQRDAAVAERSNAVLERDKALAALEAIEYARGNVINGNNGRSACGTKHLHPQHLHAHSCQGQSSGLPFDHSREVNINDAFPISTASPGTSKGRRGKRPNENKPQEPALLNKPSKSPRKRSRKKDAGGYGGEYIKTRNHEWKGQDLGLNQVPFDDMSMPAPVCSCTGEFRQCYKWGNGGWQSACCTTTLSMYPLPMMPNKRHNRVGGRKMSGSAFGKLLSRLAAEGHDLSIPLDLKNHWAKHGTNRYITIK